MLRSDDHPAHQQAAKQVAVFWPNQDGRGAHVNITGAGVAANAPHYDAAERFLEFLVGDEAQQLFTDTVNEYPIRPDLAPNPVVASFGTFKADPLPLERLEETRAEGIQIMDRAGWR
jgi:iron(III) transport system substrate-binding protein